MSYSQFETLEQTLDAFDLTPIEAQFFADRPFKSTYNISKT